MWILFAGMLATPLYVNSKFFFPFITSKALAFRLLVEAAVVLYILLALRVPDVRPRLTLVHWAVFGYWGVQVLASLLGVNLYRSFWGNAERSEGLLTLSHLVAYFFILSFTLRSWRDWRRLMLVSLGVSVLTGIYGLAQLTGQETLFGFIRILGSGRIASTIGNASFFAGYLLLHLVVAAVLFAREANWGWKVAVAGAGLFDLLILFATETRGAVLGLVVGLAVVGAWLVISVPSRKVRLSLSAAALVFVLAAVFVFVNREADWVETNGTLRRLATISAADITTQSRLAAWRASWAAWRERFFLGWGYENYNVAFNKHFPGVIYRDEGSQVWFDRAHNIVFDVGVTSGLVGLAAYASIFAAAFTVLRRWRRQTPRGRILGIILVGGLAAYVFQNLFVFDTLGTYLLFFALLAFVASGGREPDAQESKPARVYSAGTTGVATAAAVGMVVAAYFFNLRPALANRAVAEAGV
ncbi:O-antigen ligase family protein, partial [Candidatus Parcubacteria bacterium]|nr:O-antigen ligase family protein [Candidatus Parcubacteria bacterium]